MIIWPFFSGWKTNGCKYFYQERVMTNKRDENIFFLEKLYTAVPHLPIRRQENLKRCSSTAVINICKDIAAEPRGASSLLLSPLSTLFNRDIELTFPWLRFFYTIRERHMSSGFWSGTLQSASNLRQPSTVQI